MDASSVVLGLRVLLSLAVVLGLLWFLGRRLAGSGAVRARREAAMTVVGRQSLGGRSNLVLVDVAGRRLLLGVAEHGVSLLTELEVPPAPAETREPARTEIDPAELERLVLGPDGGTDAAHSPTLSPTPSPSLPAARMPAVPMPRNPLEGSILAPTTWRRAVVAVQERTLRH